MNTHLLRVTLFLLMLSPMTQNTTTQHNAQNSANSMEPASTPADWIVERAKQYLSALQNCKQPVVERTPTTAQAYLEDQHEFKVKNAEEALDRYTEFYNGTCSGESEDAIPAWTDLPVPTLFNPELLYYAKMQLLDNNTGESSSACMQIIFKGWQFARLNKSGIHVLSQRRGSASRRTNKKARKNQQKYDNRCGCITPQSQTCENIDLQKNYLAHIHVKMTGSVVNGLTTHRVLRARTESASTYMFKSTSRCYCHAPP